MLDFDGCKPELVVLLRSLLHALTPFVTVLVLAVVDRVVDRRAEERPLESHPILIGVCKDNTIEFIAVYLIAVAL